MVSKQEKAKKEWKSLSVEVELIDTTAEFADNIMTIKGPLGEVKKTFKYPNLSIVVEGGKVIMSTEKFNQRLKKIMFTYRAHLNNMIKGVKEGFEYNLVVVYSKFPMTVALKGNILEIKNLLGEKVPRTALIPQDVKVEVKGKDIKVTGIDKEAVGQVAANIEQACRITHLDRRVIQDGIYITKKPHKEY